MAGIHTKQVGFVSGDLIIEDDEMYKPSTKVIALENSGHKADYYASGTDAGLQIKAAANFLGTTSGGKLLIKSGTYSIQHDIQVLNGSNVVIEGEGVGNTVLRVDSDAVFNTLFFRNVSNIVVRNLEIDGNRGSFSNNYCVDSGTAVSNLIIENCYIHHSPKSNLHFFGSTNTNINITSCEISNAALSGVVFQDCIDTKITDCHLHDNTVRDIHLYRSDGGGSNCSIVNNHCESVTTSWNIQSQFENTRVIGNTIENGGGGGTGLGGGGVGCNRGYAIIVGNNIHSISGDDAIAVTEPTLTGAVVSANQIDGVDGYNGIFVGDGCTDVTISANLITNCSIGGIRLWGARRTTVTGNHLYNNSFNTGGNNNYSEIWGGLSTFGGGTYPTQYSTITGNSVNTLLSPYCINLGTQPNQLIENNILQGGSVATMNCTGAGNVIRHNMGYTSENSGLGTIGNGKLVGTIVHGLSTTPSIDDFRITATNNLGSSTKIWMGTAGATQFTVNVNTDPGADATFAWSANVL